MSKQNLSATSLRQSVRCLLVTGISAAVIASFSLSAFAKSNPNKGNPNVDCPDGTRLTAKYEWNGSYQAEGNGSAVTILSGANATSGLWTANQNIGAVVIKGGSGPSATNTIIYDPTATSGDFSNEGLENGGGNVPAISNIKFCAGSGTTPPAEEPPPVPPAEVPQEEPPPVPPAEVPQEEPPPVPPAEVPQEEPPPAPPAGISNVCDYIYAVHDGGLNNSQIVKIDSSLNFTPLGPEYPGHDLEALDIAPSPDNRLYAASGNNVDGDGKPGHLYTVDMITGDLTEKGNIIEVGSGIDYQEIDGISFNPVDGTLWGWTPEAGLITIDPDTAESTVVLPATGEYEDLTWDNAGEILYAAQNDSTSGHDQTARIVAYDGGPDLIPVCDIEITALVGEGEIEALEMLPDGNLAFGYNDTGNQPWAAVVNLVDCNITPIDLAYHAPLYNDIEGIAACIPSNDGIGSPSEVNDTFSAPSGFSDDFSAPSGFDVLDSTTIEFMGSKKLTRFEISLVSQVGPTWTYQVDKLEGHDLSHWNLFIGSACRNKVISSIPTATSGSTDGSTGTSGLIKWNSTSGTFSLTLDGDYPMGTLDVLAKASTGNGTSQIQGPRCND
jgi:hypothetical protein